MSNKQFPQTVGRKPIAVKYVLFVSIFIVLAIAYYYNFRRFPRSSDDANVFLSGYDMSRGNWRLTGWWLAEDNWSTIEILFYAILMKCLDWNPKLMFYLPAMLWAGVASLSVALAQAGLTGRDKAVAIMAVATPILLPIIRDNGSMEQISHAPMHIGTILYVLLCFLCVKKAMSGQSTRLKSMLAAYFLIMVLAVVADPLAIFIGAVPVIVVAAFSARYGNNPGPHRLVLALTVLAVVIARILLVVNSRTGGFQIIESQQMKFVSFSQFGSNLAAALHYFLILFGCDFFGKEVFASPINGPALSLIRLPYTVLLIFALLSVGRGFFGTIKRPGTHWPVLEGDYLAGLLAIATMIDVLAGVFSASIVDAASVRYFFPALIFGAILIARMQTRTQWLGTFFCLAFAASMAFSGLAYTRSPRGTVLLPKEVKAVLSWLSNNNLSVGFGPYWSSSIVTAATKNRVKIRALISDGQGRIKPLEWVADKRWYQYGQTSGTRAIFVLVHEEERFYNEADVIRTLGEPREKLQVGSYIVNVYDPGDERLRSLYLPPPEYSPEASSS